MMSHSSTMKRLHKPKQIIKPTNPYNSSPLLVLMMKNLLFFSSLLLNALLLFCYLSKQQPQLEKLSWTRAAANEAEMVADINCSGHGRAFLDGILNDGAQQKCECYACYGGNHCSELLQDCLADASLGDPLFLEPYWQEHASSSAIVFSGWHRMSYVTTGDNFVSVELERHVRLLHQVVGNADTDDKFIVFGSGATQLINALVFALSPENQSNSPACIVASPPYYPYYRTQTQLLKCKSYEWKGITTKWMNASVDSGTKFIEFVTSPNNPDGLLKQSVLGGSSVIYDHAYYWPHYTAITAPLDEDVMLFTISKISGHASSRFGWAVLKDEKLYRRAMQYMWQNTMGVSRDTQLRILKVMKVMIAENRREGDIFEYGHNILSTRWKMLNEVLQRSNRFSLQKISSHFCNYSKKIRQPSPAFAWLKCELEHEKDCASVLKNNGGILSSSGSNFEADSRYTRLCLIKTQDDFDLLLQRLKTLVSEK